MATSLRILAQLPPNAERVKVLTSEGEYKWKDLDELEDSDQILKNGQGQPLVMGNRPGRKKKNPPQQPQASNNQIQDVIEARNEAVKENPLYKQALKDPSAIDLFEYVVRNLAQEISILDFERQEQERKGEPISHLSLKKVASLKHLADIWFRRRDQLTGQFIDLESDAFQAVLGFILETFKQALEDAKVRSESVEVIFQSLKKLMSTEAGWISEAKKRMEK